MRRLSAMVILISILTSVLPVSLFAAPETWNEVVDGMKTTLDLAYESYFSGDAEKAKDQVDEAYFGAYEKLGFEKTVMAYISGSRAAAVEYEFSTVKKAMTAGATKAEVRAALDRLIGLLRADADRLDGKEENPLAVFFASLLIIIREGFEAIIVIGAIVAYLVKSGNAARTAFVYWGALAALGASVLMSFLLNALTDFSGANREILEGVTMLVAVVVLFYVSNWMISKANANGWSSYINRKVQSSLTKQSMFSLAFAAFLAVFREGAETILFYQALIGKTQTHVDMIWIGVGVGGVLLAILYVLIRFLSVRLPLKPFFLGTSTLLFIMSIAFVGSGIKELQAGNLVGVTAVPWIASVELLGIYPTAETLGAQGLLLAAVAATFLAQMKRWKAARAASPAQTRPE